MIGGVSIHRVPTCCHYQTKRMSWREEVGGFELSCLSLTYVEVRQIVFALHLQQSPLPQVSLLWLTTASTSSHHHSQNNNYFSYILPLERNYWFYALILFIFCQHFYTNIFFNIIVIYNCLHNYIFTTSVNTY